MFAEAGGGGKTGVYQEAGEVLRRVYRRLIKGRNVDRHADVAVGVESSASEGGREGSTTGVHADNRVAA